ncbi:LysM peptidoglycan-binding domain-containing protein [Neobacillus sp.]|uniref:LysM peptidoglycan-binding domain-containing protein n=1 Tax=Neobacillus sp. TaxID=2675273 RepID=UPI00289FDC17|nr:LysM peptidoglycan-binding domain-containing protein [Neobacillus sp.]
MNKEEPYRDQAERLKQRIQKINEQNELIEESDHLPPREEIHRQKKKKTKWKLKYPIIRLLVLCFILLPIIILSVISYLNDGKLMKVNEKTSGGTVGYETVNFEKSKKENKANSNKSEEAKETKQDNSEIGNPEEKKEEPKVDSEQPDANNHPNTTVQTPSSNVDNTNKQDSDKNSQSQTETTKSPTNTTTTKTSKIIYHKVQPQETLFKLGKKYYQSANGIDIIKKANNLKSDQIQVGQVLKIPLNK